MHLTDLHLNRFGILSDLSLDSLSPGITVFWGPNGCGKTTVVRFLRGLLFGFSSSGPGYGDRPVSEGGSLRFRTPSAIRRLHRIREVSGEETVRVTDVHDDRIVSQQDNHLPSWVTEEIFREVFSPGYEDADRFDLLTRLCLESGTRLSPVEPEIRAAEMALHQAVRERDGHGLQEGILHRVAELRRRQQELHYELNGLRRPSADLPERLQSLIREIDGITAQMERIDLRRAELDAEIHRLERQLVELRRRNIVPLDRVSIDAQIRTLTSRLERWKSIRESMQSDVRLLNADLKSDGEFRPADSLISVRALLSRLEDRVQLLANRGRRVMGSDADWNDEELTISHLKTEMAALCRYLSRHEDAVSQHQDSLEHLLAARSCSDAAQMELLLQERIASLRSELGRADDVLSPLSQSVHTGIRGSSICSHSIHRPSEAGSFAGIHASASIEETEQNLSRLRSERTRLVAERGAHDEASHARRAVLERLRQEMAAAATLEQIDSLRAQIAEIDAQIVLLEDRKRILDQSEISLKEVIERLKQRCHPRTLELASAFISRLTEGECSQILGSALAPQLLVQTSHQKEPLTIAQLSRGTRHQVALALRLALIQVRKETGGHVPLILDDVFITSDDVRASAVVQLLNELAADGQQIIFFTCQKDVRDLFLRFRADVRSFDGHSLAMDSAPVLKAYVEEARTISPPMTTPTFVSVVATPPAELITVAESTPVQAALTQVPVFAVSTETISVPSAELRQNSPTSTANWLYYLEVDHDVDDLAGINLSELEALRAAGIRSVDDLLNQPISRLEELTRARGYLLSAERLKALQGQAELTCRVPMLRRSDAALLYAAGIRTVEELAALRPETVFDRITAFQRTETGGRFRRAGRLIDRQQAINWARWGQHSRTLEDARTMRSRFSVRSMARVRPAPATSAETGVADQARPQRRDRIRQSGSLSRRRPLVSDGGDDVQRRARRLARRRRAAARLKSVSAQPFVSQESVSDHSVQERPVAMTTAGGRNLRFFLSRASSVDSAPSIGPKTADSLSSCGVRTVEDLLTINADRLAQQLNQRRITANVVQQWQAQSRLMCQVPELRGHDVQLLVGCGITDPDDLARRKPLELLAIVEPFSNSKEGERIIRSGRKPDLAEVTDWIAWASTARSFRAA